MNLKIFVILSIAFCASLTTASQDSNWFLTLPREVLLLEPGNSSLQSAVSNQEVGNKIKYQAEEIYKKVVENDNFLISRNTGFEKVRLLVILDENKNIYNLMAEFVHPVFYKTYVQSLEIL